MITKTLFPGRYMQGFRATKHLEKELPNFGRIGLCIMAHSIHNGLTVLPQTHNYYHGEKVALGVLASLFLSGKSKAIVGEVYSFCESVGLPTTLAELGLPGVSLDELGKVATRACIEGESIHHEGRGIVPEMVVHALLAADGEGQRRKAMP